MFARSKGCQGRSQATASSGDPWLAASYDTDFGDAMDVRGAPALWVHGCVPNAVDFPLWSTSLLGRPAWLPCRGHATVAAKPSIRPSSSGSDPGRDRLDQSDPRTMVLRLCQGSTAFSSWRRRPRLGEEVTVRSLCEVDLPTDMVRLGLQETIQMRECRLLAVGMNQRLSGQRLPVGSGARTGMTGAGDRVSRLPSS
jgi:hypothetical protein